jgi:hypothetical protein
MRLKFVYSFKRRFWRLVDISRTDYGKFLKAIVIEFEENRIITAISQDRVLKEGMFMTTMLCPNQGKEVFYYDKQRIPLSKQATYRYNALVSEKEATITRPVITLKCSERCVSPTKLASKVQASLMARSDPPVHRWLLRMAW